MDITERDMTILIATTTGVILMTILFPSLGLAGDQAQSSEVPRFDVDTDAFDFAGDFPTRPSSPSGGVLVYPDDHDHWITGGTNDGEFIYLINDNNDTDPVWFVEVQDWDNDAVTNEVNTTLDGEGDSDTLEEADWEISVELDRVYEDNNETVAELIYDIENDPTSEDTAWYSGVPIIGDTAEGLQWVTRTLVFLGNIFLWGILTFVEVIWNVSFALVQVTTYVIDLLSFLTSTYAEIATSPSASWAQVILAIPSVIMMAVWAKVVLVFIEVVWIG
jgi:hypothetical protein